MSEQQPSVRVVQCPKCGSPLPAARPGEVITCGYCGSTLEMGVGASGHPVARLANIEASTVYLARTEALKRVREQLAEAETVLSALRNLYAAKSEQVRQAKAQSTAWWFRGAVAIVLALLWFAGGDDLCGGAALLFGLALWAVAMGQAFGAKKKVAELERELAQISEEGIQIRAERDRLAARVAELEAGLDELATKL